MITDETERRGESDGRLFGVETQIHFRQEPLCLRLVDPSASDRLSWLRIRRVQASESSLLSRLISICSDGRLSSRLFFILWLRRSCFCLIMAPHIFCSVESSSSSATTAAPSFSSPSPPLLCAEEEEVEVEEEKGPDDRLLDVRS